VGAGTAGTTLAIFLRRAGIEVEIVEIRPDWDISGSGITLQGAALRVLREAGVYADVLARGYAFDDLGMRTPDGTVLARFPAPRTGGDDLPATVGTNRPDLARVLTDAALAAGAVGRLGLTVDVLKETDAGVDATFSDGTTGTYDLVVGADGIRSHIRELIGVPERPEPNGMAIWRVHARRPQELTFTEFAYGGPAFIAGYCPTGPDTMYAYLVERARDRADVTPETMSERMMGLARAYGGLWELFRDDIADAGRLNHTLFESLLVQGPWNRGRVVLVGDAVHACPPTLALGAAMGLEDAAVLAELLTTRREWDQDLFDAYTARRFERVRTVVEGSLQLCTWLMENSPDADVPGLMGRVGALVSRPA